MKVEEKKPQLVTNFNESGTDPESPFYRESIFRTLLKIFRRQFPDAVDGDRIDFEKLKPRFFDELPIFTHSEFEEAPSRVSFFLLSKYRPNAFNFFFDLVNSWLVPGHLLDVTLFYAVDFNLPELGDQKYTLCEVMVNIYSDFETDEIKKNLAVLKTEIKLGVSSSYYARRILESKGLSSDQKTAAIHALIAKVAKRFPDTFDPDILTEMQYMLVMCKEAFKAERTSRHLCRIVCYNYLFRKQIAYLMQKYSGKRHLCLKAFHIPQKTLGPRRLLGIAIAVNFLSDKEVLDDRHLMRAIQNHIPNVQAIENSFVNIRKGSDQIATLYIEIQKMDGSPFTQEEVLRLREELPDDLKDRVEHLMPPIFMPRNEEEIMRNILSLSNQVKFANDIPQVNITFDEQTRAHLYFTIIHVRAEKSTDKSIEEHFKLASTFLEFLPDFTKKVGTIRKKYPKVATVFRVKLPKEMFHREDHSIDLYKARQVVVSELERILGVLRDYNGGMITKQNEQLGRLRTLVEEEGVYNDLLLENFFYAISPASQRSLFETEALKILFLLLVDTLASGFPDGRAVMLSIHCELDAVYAVIIADRGGMKERVLKELKSMNIAQSELVYSSIRTIDRHCLGLIYRSDDPYKQEYFAEALRHATNSHTVKAR